MKNEKNVKQKPTKKKQVRNETKPNNRQIKKTTEEKKILGNAKK